MYSDNKIRELYTDLMSERKRADASEGVEFKRYPSASGVWERVRITSAKGAASIGRPIGNYSTLHTDPMSFVDKYSKDEIEEEIANELWDLCDMNNIIPKRVLVIGLGNRRLTPDSLGPTAAELVFPTKHIKDESEDIFGRLSCSEIAVSVPDVKSASGLDTLDTIKGISDKIKPTLIIAIDALCARDEERLGKTVQIADTGIFSGSGVGTRNQDISKESLGVPVISIGIPTVIDVGAVSKRGGRMLVTPSDINTVISTGAGVISGGINKAFGICI